MNNKPFYVFISWSDSPSKEIADLTYELLRSSFAVNSNIKFFLSSSENGGIDKGEKFQNKLEEKLFISNFGILILTKNNTKRPWIMFEAGSLAKIASIARVSPILFDIEENEIDKASPLYPFQYTKFSMDDFGLLFQSILKAYKKNMLELGTDESELNFNEKDNLNNLLKTKWDDFEKNVKELLNNHQYKMEMIGHNLINNGVPLERERHLREVLEKIKQFNGSRIIIFGGIPTVIRDATKELAKWIIDDTKSQLFICYEDDVLINDRKEDIKNEELLNKKKPKFEEFKMNLLGLLGDSLKKRIHFIELSERLSGYITLTGKELFFTPLLHMRSSETFTFKLENKQALDVIDYMASKSTNDILTQELDKLKDELQNEN